MSMDQLYQELILDHARSPHRAGLREPYDVEVHHVNPTCGDEITLRVRLAGDRVEDVSYESAGCSISVAGASVMADEVTSATVDGAMQRYAAVLDVLQGRADADPERDGDVAAFAGVRRFPARVKCALLGWAAMRDAVSQAVAAAGDNGSATDDSATDDSATDDSATDDRERS
ncbi:Fe-S cluster assembly sulfur transfer protein SufU [Quadrisphaera sp. GCM10027208]|uniref:Fe-S cluster assembly sulfur transfer protein SufU n=1 Tax=Quadrisphaera sp. GCM10027208 TaxID=3273423 RepID=UPI00362150BF